MSNSPAYFKKTTLKSPHTVMNERIDVVHAKLTDGTIVLAARECGVMAILTGGCGYAIGMRPDGSVTGGAARETLTPKSLAATLDLGENFDVALRAFGVVPGGGMLAMALGDEVAALIPDTSLLRSICHRRGLTQDRYLQVWRHPAREAIQAAAVEWPFLASFLGKDAFLDDAAATGSPHLIRDAFFASTGISLSQALIRRLRHIPLDTEHPLRVLEGAANLPIALAPSDADEWTQACRLAEAAVSFESIAPSSRPPRHGVPLVRAGISWRDAVRRIVRLTGREDAGHDLPKSMFGDVATAFVEDVLRTAYSNLGGEIDAAPGRLELELRQRAVDVLTDDLTLCEVYEVDGLWHRTRYDIERGVPKTPDLANISWPAACRDFVAKNGISVVNLHTDVDLAAEGAKDAMDHCVGAKSYIRDCARGVSAVFSLRTVNPDGSFIRHATLEVVPDRYAFRKAQLLGRKNSAAPEGAFQAYLEWIGEAHMGKLDVTFASPLQDSPAPRLDYDWSDPANIEATIEAWTRALPKRYKGASVEDLLGDELTPKAGTPYP